MSAYKLIEVVKTSEKETQSIYDKEDLTTALADMHNSFGVAVKADSTISVYCVVIEQATGQRMGGLYFATSSEDADIKQRVYTHNDYAEDNVSYYDTERLAIGNYNTKLSASMKKAECNFAITVRIDGKGEFADFNIWTRPVAPVEE